MAIQLADNSLSHGLVSDGRIPAEEYLLAGHMGQVNRGSGSVAGNDSSHHRDVSDLDNLTVLDGVVNTDGFQRRHGRQKGISQIVRVGLPKGDGFWIRREDRYIRECTAQRNQPSGMVEVGTGEEDFFEVGFVEAQPPEIGEHLVHAQAGTGVHQG